MTFKNIIIKAIERYQKIPLKSHSACPFIPTCSEYTKEAVSKYGVLHGGMLGLRRIGRCHPWQKPQYDPVK